TSAEQLDVVKENLRSAPREATEAGRRVVQVLRGRRRNGSRKGKVRGASPFRRPRAGGRHTAECRRGGSTPLRLECPAGRSPGTSLPRRACVLRPSAAGPESAPTQYR